MAAAHEPGTLRFYYERGGVRKLIHTSHSILSAPSSGAATDPRLFLDVPRRGEPLLGDGLLIAEYEANATDTIDSTDSSAQIPVILDGELIFLDLDEMDAGDVNTKYQDQPLVAKTKIVIGEYRVPKGSVMHFGGGKLFWNVFDDTA